MNSLVKFLVASGVTLLVAACGGGGGGSNDSPPGTVPVATVAVAPSDLTLNRGEQVQLGAVVKDSSGNVLQGRSVTWTSADAAKVAVTAAGLVKAISAGRASVIATVEGKRAEAQVLVVDPPAPVGRVELDTVNAMLEEGDRLQLQATAYDAGNNVLIGRGQRWTSSDPGIALVSPAGEVTGLRPGVVTVTVQIDGAQAASMVRVFANYEFDLIYSRADIERPAELYTLDLGDPAAAALPVFGPGKLAAHAAPSPDGARIAFVVYGQWDSTQWQSRIYVADRDGSNAARITFLPGTNEQPAWSPDGRRIAFRSQATGEGAHIWAVDPDGSNPLNLTADQSDSSQGAPAWSPQLPDGSSRIAYARAQGGTSLLWTMRADGSDKRQVTSTESFWDDEPVWSPDGRQLVFTRSGAAVFGDLYLVSSNGGTGGKLMRGDLAHGQFSPSWSPDGRLIAFTSKHGDGQTYQVWTVWADGTRLAQRTFDQQQHADPTWILRR